MSSFFTISFKSFGIPTSAESCFTASIAAFRYSSCVMESTPSTPIARAISRYLPPVASALYSITVGRIIAFATPCGVSYSAPRGCAIEWTIPSPTLENPMPATYCPRAMPSLPSGVLSTAPRRLFAMISIALIWNISDNSQAPAVIYPSIAWVKASMPVAAVSPFGIEAIISESTNATTGISFGSTHTIFRFFAASVIT